MSHNPPAQTVRALGTEGEDAGVWGALSEDERRAIKHADARERNRRVAQPRSSKNYAP